MPRPLRIAYECAWYHVMNRGMNHQDIYLCSDHYDIFYMLLADVSKMYGAEIHAFCLMTNHYHLLLRTPFPNISKVMAYVNGKYTQQFNRREGKDGPLFRGRYKGILIESDNYICNVSRYIHLNPVEAKMVSNPQEYIHSSYSGYINTAAKPHWLQTDVISEMLDQSYRSFVLSGNDDITMNFYSKINTPVIYAPDYETNDNLNIIRHTSFNNSMHDYRRTKIQPSILEVIGAIASYYHVGIADLLYTQMNGVNMRRLFAIAVCRLGFGFKNQAIGDIFGNVSDAYVSSAISKLKDQLRKDDVLNREFFKLMSSLEYLRYDNQLTS